MLRILSLLWQAVKLIPVIYSSIKLVNRIITSIVDWVCNRKPQKETRMDNLSIVETLELAEKLKDLKEWQVFVEEVETVVIAEIKEHKGAKWWTILLEVVVNCVSKCSESGINAIKDSALIPAQCEDQSAATWITFAVSVLLNQGKIISSIWVTPAPTEPTV